MGAGGVAVGHAAAGGQIGRALPSGGGGGNGVNRSLGGGSSTSASNQPVNVVINYGAGGPNPEDTARSVMRAVRRAQRHGMTDARV